jgi:hypothetical protein
MACLLSFCTFIWLFHKLEARRMRVMQTLPQDVALLVCVPF